MPGRPGDWPDNPQRFAALCWVAAALARDGVAGWKPDILHAHDWQAGLAPAYLRYHGAGGCRSVMTVHNIAFQGWAEAGMLADLRLPASAFHPGALEYFGGLSSLKAGLVTADRITTVSPRYAAELMRPEFGMGLEGVIAARGRCGQRHPERRRSGRLVAGVEAAHPYSATRHGGQGGGPRGPLRTNSALEVPGPLAIVVSRLTDQKGIDLLPAVVPGFRRRGRRADRAGLGRSGDWRRRCATLAARYPGRVAAQIGYDEALSHRLFAGRRCRAGAQPVRALRPDPDVWAALWHAAGGGRDRGAGRYGDRRHARQRLAAGVATGVVFHPTDALAFGQALAPAGRRFMPTARPGRGCRAAAMAQPLGWEASAAAYAALYAGLCCVTAAPRPQPPLRARPAVAPASLGRWAPR